MRVSCSAILPTVEEYRLTFKSDEGGRKDQALCDSQPCKEA